MQEELIKHPLFYVPSDEYIWYSERTYQTSEEKLIELLADFEQIRDRFEAAFQIHPEYLKAYVKIAHIIWCSYHLVAAQPLLQKIIQVNPHASRYLFLSRSNLSG